MGKSYGLALYLCQVAAAIDGCDVLYIGLTLGAAKKAIWRKGLKAVDRKLALNIKFNESETTGELPNGSMIYVMGMESSAAMKERARGGAYALVVIDEAASFGGALDTIYADVVKPAVTDYRGTVCMTGTPGLVKAGMFFKLTEGQVPGIPGTWTIDHKPTGSRWAGHRWNTYCNPYLRDQWKEEIDEMLAVNARIEETPSFQRERKGMWVVDDDKLVYRFNPERNVFDGKLPPLNGDDKWHYVLGMDLGYSPDPTAFVIAAYCDFDRCLYLLEGKQMLQSTFTEAAAQVKAYQARFSFDRIVIDGANKQGVEEMRKHHGLDLTPAEKRGKQEVIDLMNGDMIAGYVKVCVDNFPALESDPENYPNIAGQYANLVWDDRRDDWNTKRVEHPACHNDFLDAALYSWRYCYQYLAEVVPEKHAVGSPAWHRAQIDEMRQTLMDQLSARKQQEQEDREWDELR